MAGSACDGREEREREREWVRGETETKRERERETRQGPEHHAGFIFRRGGLRVVCVA